MNLTKHTKVNREFFESGSYPTPDQWRQWVLDDIVQGKLIGDKIFIDINWFAANSIMLKEQKEMTGIDLLM